MRRRERQAGVRAGDQRRGEDVLGRRQQVGDDGVARELIGKRRADGGVVDAVHETLGFELARQFRAIGRRHRPFHLGRRRRGHPKGLDDIACILQCLARRLQRLGQQADAAGIDRPTGIEETGQGAHIHGRPLWRAISNKTTAAAAEALSDSVWRAVGMWTRARRECTDGVARAMGLTADDQCARRAPIDAGVRGSGPGLGQPQVEAFDGCRKIAGVHRLERQVKVGAGGGADHLGIEGIDRAAGEQDQLHSGGQRRAQHRPQVPGIRQPIEHQRQVEGGWRPKFGKLDDGDEPRGRLGSGAGGHDGRRHRLGLRPQLRQAVHQTPAAGVEILGVQHQTSRSPCRHRLSRQVQPFDDESLLLFAGALAGQQPPNGFDARVLRRGDHAGSTLVGQRPRNSDVKTWTLGSSIKVM